MFQVFHIGVWNARPLRSSRFYGLRGAFAGLRSCSMMKQTASPSELAQWNRLAYDGAMLWMEASQVMWLRTMRIMAGGA